MDIFEKCNQRYIQDEVRDLGIYPYFHALESRQDTEVIMEGKRRIMLGSNNYLGLTTNEAVIKAGMHAYETLGSGCSGSRFLNGTLKLHLELEDELAKFLRKDAVVTFSTGFQSNLGIISAIVGLHDYVIMDRENHASLYDGCKLSYGKMLRYQHNDMADLEKKLQKVPETAGCLIVTDGVFSMGGDIANLPEICALAQKYGARVMVDDAHGLGISGANGRGPAEEAGVEDAIDFRILTFGKAAASSGAALLADPDWLALVTNYARPLIFTTAESPLQAAWTSFVLSHVPSWSDRRTRLRRLEAKVLETLGSDAPAHGTPILPWILGDNARTLAAAKRLEESGFLVSAVRPPTVPEGTSRLRISLASNLTDDEIDAFCLALTRLKMEFSL